MKIYPRILSRANHAGNRPDNLSPPQGEGRGVFFGGSSMVERRIGSVPTSWSAGCGFDSCPAKWNRLARRIGRQACRGLRFVESYEVKLNRPPSMIGTGIKGPDHFPQRAFPKRVLSGQRAGSCSGKSQIRPGPGSQNNQKTFVEASRPMKSPCAQSTIGRCFLGSEKQAFLHGGKRPVSLQS